MHKVKLLLTALVALPLLTSAGLQNAQADEDDRSFDELPTVVQNRVLELTHEAILDEIEIDNLKGHPETVVYEIEYRINGEEWELEIRDDGEVLKHERDD